MRMNLEGLGDGAQCPSAEQLAGVVDINDPCQSAGISQLTTGNLSNASTIGAAINGESITAPASLLSGMSNTTLLIAGAAVVALFVFVVPERHR